MDEELDRRLVAVMFTDMVGYTALFQADERVALGKRNRYTAAVERHHENFGGTIMQRLGDGTMGMFPSSLAAVQAAVEMQRELAGHDVPVRIGIHVGEVIVEPHGLIGDPVNVASRIESFAVPGGVMLSDAEAGELGRLVMSRDEHDGPGDLASLNAGFDVRASALQAQTRHRPTASGFTGMRHLIGWRWDALGGAGQPPEYICGGERIVRSRPNTANLARVPPSSLSEVPDSG